MYIYVCLVIIILLSLIYLIVAKGIKNKKRIVLMYRPPKVRPKNLTIGGRYFYGKIQLWIQKAGYWSIS